MGAHHSVIAQALDIGNTTIWNVLGEQNHWCTNNQIGWSTKTKAVDYRNIIRAVKKEKSVAGFPLQYCSIMVIFLRKFKTNRSCDWLVC